MSEAKRFMRPLSPWIVTAFGFGLAFLESGCTGLSGLRSVAPDHTSLLGFWDRPQVGSPAPGTDHYAAYVHAGRDRAGLETKAPENPLLAHDRPIDPLEPDSSPELAANTGLPGGYSRGAASTERDRTGMTHVTLGRPEPLPALALDDRARRLAAADSSRSWRPERPPVSSESASEPAAPRPDESATLVLATPAPAALAASESGSGEATAVLAEADAALKTLKTYSLKVSRIERIGGKLQPREDMSLSVRAEPKAVRLEWADGPNKGREVIYSSALDPKMIFVHMANSAIPLPPMKISVDSPLVMKNSRHSITEAGLETIVEQLRNAERHEAGSSGEGDVLEYKGLEKVAGFDRSCNKFLIRSSSGDVWTIFLDTRSKLPCVVICEDKRGELIERYVYRDLVANPPDLALADAFEPEKRWGGDSKSLLSRLARAASGADLPANSQTRTR